MAQVANMGHQSAGGHSSWCPKVESRTAQSMPCSGGGLAFGERQQLVCPNWSSQGLLKRGCAAGLGRGRGTGVVAEPGQLDLDLVVGGAGRELIEGPHPKPTCSPPP